MGNEVAVAYVTLLPSARGFRSNTERALRPHVTGAGASMGTVFGRSFGRTASTALTSNTTGIRSALKSFSTDATSSFTTITAAASTLVGVLGGIGLRTAASLQSAQIGFETLLGSAKEATKFLGSVRDFAVRTPFEVNSLIANSRALLGVGVAAKGIIPTLTSLGNVTAAFGLNQEQFNGILRAFTQIASKGKVQAEELLQMSEQGLPAMQLFAKGLHISVAELLKLTQASGLTAKKALPALLKQLNKDYGGAMARQFDTLTGVYNNFKESAKLALSDGVQPLVPILQSALPKATKKAQGAISAVSHGLQQFINGLRGKQGLDVTLFERIGQGVATAFAAVKTAFLGIKSVIVANKATLAEIATVVTGRVIPAVAAIAAVVGQVAVGAFGALFAVLGRVGVPTVRVLARVLERTAGLLGGLVDFVKANQDFIVPFAAGVAVYAVTVKTVAGATRAWAAAQLAVNAAMALNPYIVVGAAVVGLTVLMYRLSGATYTVQSAVKELNNELQFIAKQLATALLAPVRAILRAVKLLFKVTDVIDGVGHLFGKNSDSPWDSAEEGLQRAINATDEWQRAINRLPNSIHLPVSFDVTVNAKALSPLTGAAPNGQGLLDALKRSGLPSDEAIAARLKDQAKHRDAAVLPKKKHSKPFDFENLLKQLGLPSTADTTKASTAAADRIKKVADKAKQALKDARQQLADYAKSVADGIKSFADPTGITSATGAAATPNSVANFLNRQLATIKKFQANLKALSKRGISNTLLRQIADAGPETGGPLAEALVRANDTQFADISKTAAAINKRANASGAFVAGQVLGSKVSEARTNVEHLDVHINNPKPERASTTAPKAVRRALLAAG